MLGNIGTGELLIILAVLIAIFGKKKTNEIARDAGEASKELKKAGKEALEAFEEIQKPVVESNPADKPKEETPSKVEEESTVKGGEESGA
jgi:TatA/E family protein of Tat protein translocase